MKSLLLITPLFTQLNTPYPATAYLKGFLNTKNISAFQIDLGIEVIIRLFSKEGLIEIFELGEKKCLSLNSKRIFALRQDYIKSIDAVISFLQGKNPTLARQICQDSFLPEASRFKQLDDLEWAFGNMGHQDKAKHLATLYLEDLSDFILECVDCNFGFSRYAERLGRSANSFEEMFNFLQNEPTHIDFLSLEILENQIRNNNPDLVCFSVPFPGNLYSAFRCAQFIKNTFPTIKIAMGGGFPNTELRDLKDIRVFDFFDFISLDDGELPIELLAIHCIGKNLENKDSFKRTLLKENQQVVYKNNSLKLDYKQSQVGTPDYSDLLLDKYISVIEIANPMHSLWSDGRWNKLTLAHGCYWGKCTFCDISLDYIKLYEPIAAKTIVDRMQALIAQTNENGFHFVDEAAPPSLMKEVAIEIIKRKLTVTWWTNIRFEKSFTQDVCFLLKSSGCIAVSGGLEVASDRLLELIQKGVTVAQVAQVCQNFTDSGIMVHAYLMYGYPTQTIQETIDSLEMVRQMFELGILQSGFWHQFALTAHSPIGLNPEEYGVIPQKKMITFANNDIVFKDKTRIDHDKFSFGLKKSLFNFMHGICFEYQLQEWFEFRVPKTTIKPNYIEKVLKTSNPIIPKDSAKIVWLGGMPEVEIKSNKNQDKEKLELTFHDKKECFTISSTKEQGLWLESLLEKTSIYKGKNVTLKEVKIDFERSMPDFELFWYSKPINTLKEYGLLIL